MINKVLFFVFVLVISAFTMKSDDNIYRPVSHDNFTGGEVLEYKVSYGMFSVGKAQIKISEDQYKINGRDCYKIDVFGKTTGAVDWVAKVNDNWGAYVDSAALVPHIAYRYLEEGSYRKKEIIKFDHTTDMAEAKVMDKKTGEFKEPKYYKTPDNVRDMVGGFMYLRTIDFNKLNVGDIVELDAFFEDTAYDFNIMYQGKDVVRTKLGKINTFKLIPLMPDNKIFDGENSITVWLSDDENKVPVRIEADMFMGKAGCEIIKYDGLVHEINYDKKKKRS